MRSLIALATAAQSSVTHSSVVRLGREVNARPGLRGADLAEIASVCSFMR